MWSRVIREAYSDAPKAAFLLHAGDLINTAEADAEWGEWFGAGSWINAMMPNIAVPGNHEMAKREGDSSSFHIIGGHSSSCRQMVLLDLKSHALRSNITTC